MINFILSKFKELSDALIALDQKLGFKKFARYVLFVILIICLCNIRTIFRETVEVGITIAEEIHNEKMKLRDEYMTDLTPLLTEFRAEMNADRILYLEYHNSEENLDGIPFKFFDLMKCSSHYGVPEVPGIAYKDIGASMYTELFDTIVKGEVVTCSGEYDISFRKKYPGVYEIEERKGEDTKCLNYCSCNKQCPYYLMHYDQDIKDIHMELAKESEKQCI